MCYLQAGLGGMGPSFRLPKWLRWEDLQLKPMEGSRVRPGEGTDAIECLLPVHEDSAAILSSANKTERKQKVSSENKLQRLRASLPGTC